MWREDKIIGLEKFGQEKFSQNYGTKSMVQRSWLLCGYHFKSSMHVEQMSVHLPQFVCYPSFEICLMGKTDTACICQFPIRKLGSLHRSLAKEEICGRYHGLACRKSKPLNIFIFAEVKTCKALEDNYIYYILEV